MWMWGLGLTVFYLNIYTLPDGGPFFRTCSAGIVLTGGKGRLSYTFHIFKNKDKLKQLLISGVSADPRDIHLFWEHKGVTFGHMARNTVENVKEASLWVRKHKIKQICLITHDYHMPRSEFLFRKLLPQLSLLKVSISSSFEERLRFGFVEYNKLLISYVLFFINRILGISLLCP
jgi:hypothetical protein